MSEKLVLVTSQRLRDSLGGHWDGVLEPSHQLPSAPGGHSERLGGLDSVLEGARSRWINENSVLERARSRWIHKNNGFVASRREGDAPQPAVQLRGAFQ